MTACRICKDFWRRHQEVVSSRHHSGCAVLRCEIVKQPYRSNYSKWLTTRAPRPISMHTLLPIPRQRVAATNLSDSELDLQHVIHRSQQSWICVYDFESLIAICEIIGMTSAALFHDG